MRHSDWQIAIVNDIIIRAVQDVRGQSICAHGAPSVFANSARHWLKGAQCAEWCELIDINHEWLKSQLERVI